MPVAAVADATGGGGPGAPAGRCLPAGPADRGEVIPAAATATTTTTKNGNQLLPAAPEARRSSLQSAAPAAVC